jgi:hypothetical protein
VVNLRPRRSPLRAALPGVALLLAPREVLPSAVPRLAPRSWPRRLLVAPLRSVAPARCGFGSRGRGAPAWHDPLPTARPPRARDSFAVRQRGLARACARVASYRG